MRRRAMLEPRYVPAWDGPVAGYATNQAVRNLWRVQRTHDLDDLMQECRLVFHKCCLKYPVLDTGEHFMALYKTALRNWLNHLSNRSTRHGMEFAMSDESGAVGDGPGALDNDGFLLALVRQAPREVSMVLSLFISAPAELLELAESAWGASRASKATRSDLDAMLRRLLGPEVGERPLERVAEYFRG